MSFDITEGNDLYVFEEVNSRGDISQKKFKVQVPLIKQAVDYALLSQSERNDQEEEIDEFLDSFENYSITRLLACIVCCNSYLPNFDPNDIMVQLVEKGRFGVEGEEECYGVGVTKELAYQAFSEIQVNVNDEGWD